MTADQTTTNTNNPSDQALIAMMQTQLATLQSIKAGEMQWLQFYTIVTVPAIGFLMASDPCKIAPMVGLTLFAYLLITGWFQYVLLKERHSYFGVLRSVVRAQNLLGLYKSNFLSPHFANSAFPKKLGPCKAKDGTHPYSSFLNRQLYVCLFFVGLTLAGFYQARHFWGLTVLLIDTAWVFVIFIWDRKCLYRQTFNEQNLSGSDPKWFTD
jgi:hypothetical protein